MVKSWVRESSTAATALAVGATVASRSHRWRGGTGPDAIVADGASLPFEAARETIVSTFHLPECL